MWQIADLCGRQIYWVDVVDMLGRCVGQMWQIDVLDRQICKGMSHNVPHVGQMWQICWVDVVDGHLPNISVDIRVDVVDRLPQRKECWVDVVDRRPMWQTDMLGRCGRCGRYVVQMCQMCWVDVVDRQICKGMSHTLPHVGQLWQIGDVFNLRLCHSCIGCPSNTYSTNTCQYTHIHMCQSTHIYTYIHTCIHTHTYIHTYTYIQWGVAGLSLSEKSFSFSRFLVHVRSLTH